MLCVEDISRYIISAIVTQITDYWHQGYGIYPKVIRELKNEIADILTKDAPIKLSPILANWKVVNLTPSC